MKGIYSGVLLVFLGLLLVGFGVALGVGDVDGCGPIFGSAPPAARSLEAAICSDELSKRALGVWSLIIIGFVLGFLGVLQLVSVSRRRSDAAEHGVATHSGGSGGIASELAKLADMHASGVLTDNEFEQAKRETLGRNGNEE